MIKGARKSHLGLLALRPTICGGACLKPLLHLWRHPDAQVHALTGIGFSPWASTKLLRPAIPLYLPCPRFLPSCPYF